MSCARSIGMAKPYFLRTERLAFGCWSAEDFPAARELWGDSQVTQFFGGPFSDEEIAERLRKEIGRKEAHGFQYWPIYLQSDNEHVGCCGLRPYRSAENIHELGFHLRPKYWGQELAVEAARAIIAFSFANIGARGLSAGHHPANLVSKKVIEKLGFRYSHSEFFEALGIDIPYYLLRSRDDARP